MTDHNHEPRPAVEKPNRWIGPFLLLLVVGIPIVILIFSNTEPTTIEWAGFQWKDAPRWLVLLATFVAGLVLSPIFGWLWRAWRRRRRRLADEAEVLRRRTEPDEEG